MCLNFFRQPSHAELLTCTCQLHPMPQIYLSWLWWLLFDFNRDRLRIKSQINGLKVPSRTHVRWINHFLQSLVRLRLGSSAAISGALSQTGRKWISKRVQLPSWVELANCTKKPGDYFYSLNKNLAFPLKSLAIKQWGIRGLQSGAILLSSSRGWKVVSKNFKKI